jgi:addiction module RelE/StbE family toxin
VTLTYLHEFLTAFLGLEKTVQRQIRKKLDEMARTPLEEFPHQALKGEQFKGLFKLRIGDWRLIYKISEGQIHFITLGHRSEVYR